MEVIVWHVTAEDEKLRNKIKKQWNDTLDDLKVKARLKVILSGVLTSGSTLLALKFLILYIETVFGYATGNPRAIASGMIASLVTAVLTARECGLSLDQLSAIVDLQVQVDRNEMPGDITTAEGIERHVNLLAEKHRKDRAELNRTIRYATKSM